MSAGGSGGRRTSQVDAVAKSPGSGPRRLPGSRVRVSTAVLVILFGAVWWVHDLHRHNLAERDRQQSPATQQVLPPGFVPDPAYTWVPRTKVSQPTTVTETVTETVIPPPVTQTVRPRPKPGPH